MCLSSECRFDFHHAALTVINYRGQKFPYTELKPVQPNSKYCSQVAHDASADGGYGHVRARYPAISLTVTLCSCISLNICHSSASSKFIPPAPHRSESGCKEFVGDSGNYSPANLANFTPAKVAKIRTAFPVPACCRSDQYACRPILHSGRLNLEYEPRQRCFRNPV